MRALLYLLTLTFSYFLKNGYCVISFKDFISNDDAMTLVGQYHNKEISTQQDLEKELKKIGVEICLKTLNKYLRKIREAGGGSRINFDQLKNDPRAMVLVAQYNNNQIIIFAETKKTAFGLIESGGGSRISYFDQLKNNPRAMFYIEQHYNNQITKEHLLTELNNMGFNMGIYTLENCLRKITADGGGYRKSAFEHFKNDPRALFYIEQYNNDKTMTREMLLTELNNMGFKMVISTLDRYLANLNKAGSGAPNLQAPQFARQSSNFTSGNPGSSTSASNKGKSTNFSKASNSDNWSLSSITGASSHYGGAMPSQQAPPMDDTFVPSQVGTDSMNWFGENWQSNDGSLQSMVNPKNPNLFKRALGFMSNLGGASPQEPQFSPSIHDTAAASSYYPSNQPDDGSLQTMFTPRNPSSMPYQQAPPMQDTFVPFQTGTHSTNFFGWNSQNNDGDLDSMIRPKNTSSSGGFYGTPFLPNQSQSTGWPGASNFFSPTPNTSNFTSGNPGSSAIPFQQVPMPGTSFPSFSNQSAQLNSSTNFGPSQNETNWSGGNSQNNEGDLYSMVRPKKSSSSKSKNATKTGKKPRK